jgi:magnesium chelatase subunit D
MKRHETSSKRSLSDSRRKQTAVYPFSAIVGQEEMKRALLLNLIDPLIGGVLLMGHRGTGKSTIVRSLAALLAPIRVVRDCLFHCDPDSFNELCDECLRRAEGPKPLKKGTKAVTVIDLPLGATEDMLCGSIDLHAALTGRPKVFEPGILARANRGILYVDEVNLLEDHLVDLLLDVASSGINIVEREGISIRHPARFFLVGSGNPEEGELRPQLLDRFGLHVEVETEQRIESRMEIVERREAFDRNPEAFCSAAEKEQRALRRRLQGARQSLPRVELGREILEKIIELCQGLRVDGHRGELVISRGARALAAFECRQKVLPKDVTRVAVMALRHRLRRDPLQSTPSGHRIEQALEKLFENETETEIKNSGENQERSSRPSAHHLERQNSSAHSNGHQENLPSSAPEREYSPLNLPARNADVQDDAVEFVKRKSLRPVSRLSGRRMGRNESADPRIGRCFTSTPRYEKGDRLAVGATLRAVAARLPVKDGQHDSKLTITQSDLRFKKCRRPSRRLFILLIDSSGSMAQNRIDYAKGAVGQLLRRSYVRRAYVALISFCDGDAQIVLPPTRSILRASKALNDIAVHGPTPLPAGIQRALELARMPSRDGWEKSTLLIFTDGNANVSISRPDPLDTRERNSIIASELGVIGSHLHKAGVDTVVVDTQNRFVNTGAARRLSENLAARYIQLQIGKTDTDLGSVFE